MQLSIKYHWSPTGMVELIALNNDQVVYRGLYPVHSQRIDGVVRHGVIVRTFREDTKWSFIKAGSNEDIEWIGPHADVDTIIVK